MDNDLMTMFDEASAEDVGIVEDSPISRNAKVTLGDDEEVSVETSDVDDSEVDDTDDDIVEQDDAGSDSDDAPEDVFDFDSIKDNTVSVTVNGETFEVPLSELRNGYMRQADYTRKTQQVAADSQVLQWAREMQEAFRVDPAGSIRYLQEQFGLADKADDPWQDIDPEFKPVVDELKRTQQELAELRRQTQQVQASRVDADVQAELDSMRSRYQDFDPMLVLPIAIENGLSMDKAYKLWKADRLEADLKVSEDARKKAEAAAASRAKARKAAKTVQSGGSKASAEADDSWKQFDSFEDIFAYEVEKTRS
jgi:hypothetical protein